MPAFSAALPTYLFKDPRTDTFYLRFRYTKVLAGQLGTPQFKRSLRTKDRDTARFLASFIYRILKHRMGMVSRMDRKWAGIYLKELYDRLLQRGKVALISEDPLSFTQHTGPDGEADIAPSLSANELSQCGPLIQGYPYQETYQAFQAWYEFQNSLASVDSDEEKARLTLAFINQQKQAEYPHNTAESQGTGLDATSHHPRLNDQGQWLTGGYDTDKLNSFGLPYERGTELQKRLFSLQGTGPVLSMSEFSEMLLKMQKELYEALNDFREQLAKHEVNRDATISGLTDSVLYTEAFDVNRHLEAYRDAVRALKTQQALTHEGITEADLMAEPELDEAGKQQLIAELEAKARQMEKIALAQKAGNTPIQLDPVPFNAHFEKFKKRREKEVGPESMKKMVTTQCWVVECLGENWDCAQIDADNVVEILDKLGKDRTAKTLNGYLTYLNQFFIWLHKLNKVTAEQGRIFEGQRLKESRRNTNSWMKFEDDEVKSIFEYQFQKPKRGTMEAIDYPLAAYWFPKLAMYSGMRLSEIAELKLKDVRRESYGGWVMWVTDKSEEEEEQQQSKSNKTASAIRTVPIHKALHSMGFVDFVKEQQSQREEGYLFHELFEGGCDMPLNGWGSPISKWFNRTALVKMGIKTRRKVFHSTRSTFISRLKKRGADAYIAKQIVGHDKVYYDMSSMDLTFDGYAGDQRTDFDVLQEFVDRVSYDIE